MDAQLLISVVDDDQSVRESLPDLLNELGFSAKAFASAEEFLVSGTCLQSSCLILDIALPRMSGPELLHELRRRNMRSPVIFITGRRDEVVRSQMLRDGAIACLFKPFSDTDLSRALDKAVTGQ